MTLQSRGLTIKGILSSLLGIFRPSGRIETGQRKSINQTATRVQSFSTSANIYNEHFQRRLLYSPVRDPARAALLNRLAECPETATIVNTIANDCLSSSDGDDMGFSIPETMEDEEPIDPVIREIGNALIKRCLSVVDVAPIIAGFLEDGDCFRSLVIDPSMNRIVKVKDLPTWEIFRIENEHGFVTHFEQRRHLSDTKALELHPAICIHWRHRRRGMYGRSLWEEAAETVSNMDSGYTSLNKAAIAVGVNPNKHMMTEGWGAEQTKAYKSSHENRLRKNETITDYYLYGGADVGKVASGNPDLGALISNIEHHRRRVSMIGRIPGYLLGLDTPAGSKDLSGAPQLAYARFIAGIRQVLSVGIKQIIDMELALHGYIEPESRQYRLIFPKIYTDPLSQSADAEAEGEEGSGQSSSQKSQDLDATIAQFRRMLESNGKAN